jgi:hypothetical protein
MRRAFWGSLADLSSIRNQLIRKELIFASGPGVVEFRMPLTEQYIVRNREALERRARRSAIEQARKPAGEPRRS